MIGEHRDFEEVSSTKCELPHENPTDLVQAFLFLSAETIHRIGMTINTNNTIQMERNIYSRANSKAEYLALVASVIIRIRFICKFFKFPLQPK